MRTVKQLSQVDAQQFKQETELVIWPKPINTTASTNTIQDLEVTLGRFNRTKSYRIIENHDRFEIASYFDVESGLRIGSTWKSEANTRQTNLFQSYRQFERMVLPSQIIRRRPDSEEILSVTSVTMTEAPLTFLKPPRRR